MTAVIRVALAALSLALLPGCRIVNGSGTPDEKTIEVDSEGVDTIEVASGLEVHADIGTSQEVRIAGDDNLIDEVSVKVVDHSLQIDWIDTNAVYGPTEPMVIEVEVPELEVIHSSGGATVVVGALETPRLTLESSGGGSTRFASLTCPDVSLSTSGGGDTVVEALSGEELRVASSGGGTWDLAGSASTMFIDMSGGGNLAAFELEVSEANLSMSGGGHAELAVSDTITGAASGGSVIVVQGDPEQNVSLSGGSTLTLE
jgi:hypothetical protein